ncbi:Flp family type IVb pilin [Vibrio sp. D173a]|uniref:Flp family type IVb pilin n=1 Tax=unclassified Vibrio TaxID=2614977 RepID=UPI002557435A|nr:MULTISPECIES: Flp family type IVb pilin [unclassified Vibrio]MDK9738700.1 Flp family type IVb pilin [Vibrio sp. D404a]MDK9758909.1 Flp family type IVb pilin [Vibrio sp. D173a]MDK9795488.1 Flp family type IVb pilin [Vibrio sp. D449a]
MFLSTYIKAKLLLEEFAKDERGVTAIEYAVLGVAVAAVIISVFNSTDNSSLDNALSEGVKNIKKAMDGSTTN